MKTKILLTIIVLLALCGCKTVEHAEKTKTLHSSDVTVNERSDQRRDIKKTIDSTKLTIDKGNISEQITEETITVVYAPADSTGKQAIVAVTATKRGITRNENKNLKENKQSSEQLIDKEKQTSAGSLQGKDKNKQTKATDEKTEADTPGWVLWLVVILSLGGLGLVYLVLKRYRVVK
jgi:cobalamin biosynthesis Mg chelatase CobN